MKIKHVGVISVCMWIFCVVPAAAAQSIAEDAPPQTSPDTNEVTSPDTKAVDDAIKEKLEAAGIGAGTPSHLKAPSSPSRSRTNRKHRSHRH
jgi:hypothetical protein